MSEDYTLTSITNGSKTSYIFIFPKRGNISFTWLQQKDGSFKCNHCKGTNPTTLHEMAFQIGYHLAKIDNTEFTFRS